MIVRTLSLSKLRKLLSSSSLSTYTYRRPVYNFNPSLILVGSPTFSSSLQNPAKTLPLLFLTRYFSTQQLKNQSFTNITLSRDGNYDEAASDTIPVCPGCGIYMQDSDSKQPGFFVKPLPKSHRDKKIGKKGSFVDESEIPDILKRGLLNEIVEIEKPENPGIPDEVFDENSKTVKNLGSPDEKVNEKPIVCARCHSLRHYGLVKEPGAEILLPDFDFDHTVGRRLISITGARTVVLMVVDAVDFDGSFPKKVAELVSRTIDENSRSWKEGKSGNLPRVVLVVTKIDLLPSSLSPTRLEHWVRARAREGGSGKLTSVHLVSAVRDWGVKNLVDDVAGLAGPRGQVWAIGAQNAGKSTLLNAIGKCVGRKLTHLTEAPVPGTTLGIVRMEGVFPGNAKLFDTPGLLHPHQISTRLTREEQKLIHIGKELKPRTYRIKGILFILGD
ncbi:GTP-binding BRASSINAZOLE INSENSITIVE PALE GREEN 2, chloroplastic [Olea europaea subsp. europaea]|uniref:GTP-binding BRASSINAZOLE INSENSITIVE PALE GREEN 2, chloroplastic n=1 Tax=Olea europaea subsp. europaea TaxID=158383 RepID=A0A8S0SKF9_OLEEU|nr:GTP-binding BRASSINAZOLE INSENSITIVE PALE GREEN 2, chloroplastic [Olea europaea subsp. europaea]